MIFHAQTLTFPTPKTFTSLQPTNTGPHTRIRTIQVAARLPNAMEMTTHVSVNLAMPSAWFDCRPRVQERRRLTRGGRQSNCADNCVTRRSRVAPGPPEVFSTTDRPALYEDRKFETDRDRDLFSKIDRDRSTLEKVRS